ncbi:MAG: LutC/YkgG family protein [Actinomycetota bacterium]
MNNRERVLSAIRTSLSDVPDGERPIEVDVPRGGKIVDPVELFVERVREYRGLVRSLPATEVPTAAREICRANGVTRLVVPPGVDESWLPAEGIEVVPDGPLTAAELDEVGGVLTGCRLAIAETGTIVLDGGPISGRRVITLVPDVHLCVISADQIVGSVPEAVDRLDDSVATEGLPLTFVSGPSATSDIEFNRVEGVHGPRHLAVLLI